MNLLYIWINTRLYFNLLQNTLVSNTAKPIIQKPHVSLITIRSLCTVLVEMLSSNVTLLIIFYVTCLNGFQRLFKDPAKHPSVNYFRKILDLRRSAGFWICFRICWRYLLKRLTTLSGSSCWKRDLHWYKIFLLKLRYISFIFSLIIVHYLMPFFIFYRPSSSFSINMFMLFYHKLPKFS